MVQITESSDVNLSRLQADSEMFRRVNSPRSTHDSQGPLSFNLTLKIFYKTNFGESLQVVGSIQELGAWKAYVCPLRWTEGHIWEVQVQIKSAWFFCYKYVVMKEGKAVRWEKGPKRVADLSILPDSRKKRSSLASESSSSWSV